VVTRAELLRAGVTAAEIKHRLATGALLREHPGVFRVGHRAFSVEARYLAAVRACGEGAVLSGRAAAHLYGLVRGQAPWSEVIARYRRRVRGVKTRQARRIDERDVTVWRGIPITTVARTLTDLASQVGPGELGRACHEAGIRYGTTPSEVEEVLVRRPTAPGARALRRIMSGDEPITLSKLERRFHTLLRDNGLPLPATNKRVGTARATPGSRTAAASGTRAPAETSSAAIRTATSAKTPRRCSGSCAGSYSRASATIAANSSARYAREKR
jgi:hypothetical protein